MGDPGLSRDATFPPLPLAGRLCKHLRNGWATPRMRVCRKPSGAAPLGKDDSAHGGETDAPAMKL